MKNLFTIALLLIVAACASPKSKKIADTGPKTCDDIKAFFKTDLDAYQREMDQASKLYQEEQWRVETADPKASPEKLSKLFVEMQKKAYNKDVLENTKIMEKNTAHLKVAECPLREKLGRVKGILEATILTNDAVVKMEKENQDRQDAMVAKSNAFRMTVPGEKEPISRALYSKKLASLADRSEREKLYKEFNPDRAERWVEWGFRDLLKARNAEAKAAGFNNFYEYRFFRAQLDFKNYRAMVEEIKTKLAPKVRKAVKKLGTNKKLAKVEDWDLRYLREQSSAGEINELLKSLPEKTVLDIAREFWSALGIDVDSYQFTMDLYPRPGKNTHAFAMSVVYPHVDDSMKVLPEPRMDVRFLANLKQPVKWDDISTVIHELGHAIHAAEVRQPLSIFRGFGSVDTEAIAMTVERMAASQEFYESVLPKYTKVKLAKLRPMLRKQVQAQAMEQAFVLLRQVYFSDFEYELYKNPDADYAALWSKMHAEYWGVEVPEKLAAWDVEHFLMAPVYVQNYAIGITMVEQFYDVIRKEFKTSYKSVELGNRLRQNYFSHGQEYSYLDLVEKFTGKPLTAAAALKLLN